MELVLCARHAEKLPLFFPSSQGTVISFVQEEERQLLLPLLFVCKCQGRKGLCWLFLGLLFLCG